VRGDESGQIALQEDEIHDVLEGLRFRIGLERFLREECGRSAG
jgi:hypothetical protein